MKKFVCGAIVMTLLFVALVPGVLAEATQETITPRWTEDKYKTISVKDAGTLNSQFQHTGTARSTYTWWCITISAIDNFAVGNVWNHTLNKQGSETWLYKKGKTWTYGSSDMNGHEYTRGTQVGDTVSFRMRTDDDYSGDVSITGRFYY